MSVLPPIDTFAELYTPQYIPGVPCGAPSGTDGNELRGRDARGSVRVAQNHTRPELAL